MALSRRLGREGESVTTRIISWDSLVAQAEPDHHRKSQFVREYEFTSPGGSSKTGNENTHAEGQRIFMGNYQERGAYTPETVGENEMTWNGVPISFLGRLEW